MESAQQSQARGTRWVHRWAAGAFCLALVVRLAYVLTLSAPPSLERLRFDDEKVYVRVAGNFRAGLGLVQEPGYREASKAPGYPLILALCAPGDDFRAFVWRVRILQTVVGAGTCLLVWLLVRRLYGEVAGIAAAWIAAIYPFLIFYCGELLSEAFFIPAFLGAVLLLDMADGNGIGRRDTPLWRRRLAAAVSAGLVLGIATLIRSSSLLFLLFYLPFWLLKGAGKGALASQAGQQTPVRQRHASAVLRVLALFALAVLAQSLTLLPWTTRNYRKFHAFVPTTLQTGESLYEANSPYATGGPAWHLVDWKKESDGRQMEELENDQFWRRKALEWIRTHPGDFLRLAAVKLGRFWSPVPNYKGMRTPFYVTVSLLSYGPVMLLALYGLALSISRWRRLLVLVAPILYYTALHAVYVGSIRYRTPVMPFVMAFSGWAVALLLTRALRARRALILPGGQG